MHHFLQQFFLHWHIDVSKVRFFFYPCTYVLTIRWINGSDVAFSSWISISLLTVFVISINHLTDVTSYQKWRLLLCMESKNKRTKELLLFHCYNKALHLCVLLRKWKDAPLLLWKSSIDCRHWPESELKNLFGSHTETHTLASLSGHACVLQVEFWHMLSLTSVSTSDFGLGVC